jgi:hypothetical protein
MVNRAYDERPNVAEDFWGEISPVNHSVQIYAKDETFLNTLEGFVMNGLNAGECVIIIATLAHRTALEKRLIARGIDVTEISARDQYIALDARMSLSLFMVDHWPNENLFERFVSQLLTRAHGNSRRVRAFGEMVAMLWSHGHRDATMRLEQLWHKFCEGNTFSLFCAYPQSGFTQEVSTSTEEICALHSRVIAG